MHRKSTARVAKVSSVVCDHSICENFADSFAASGLSPPGDNGVSEGASSRLHSYAYFTSLTSIDL